VGSELAVAAVVVVVVLRTLHSIVLMNRKCQLSINAVFTRLIVIFLPEKPQSFPHPSSGLCHELVELILSLGRLGFEALKNFSFVGFSFTMAA